MVGERKVWSEEGQVVSRMKYKKCTFRLSESVSLVMYNQPSDLKMRRFSDEKPGRHVRACLSRIGLNRDSLPSINLMGVKTVGEDEMDPVRWNPVGKWKNLRKVK